jgi:hypothetical protein
MQLNAFLLILWSGGISYVRPFFPPRGTQRPRAPGAPVLAEWPRRAQFPGLHHYKNALAVIIVRRLAVLDRLGKVFSPLMPAQNFEIVYHLHSSNALSATRPSSCTCLCFSVGSVRRCFDSKHYPIIGKQGVVGIEGQ